MSTDDLDIEQRDALQAYLQTRFSPRDEFEIVEFEVLAGGVSSRTVRVKLSGGQEWVLKQALAKLRVQADWFSDPRRVHREALGMKVLGELTPPGSVPKLIFDDETHHVLGMEAVPRPHENWKTMLLAGQIDAEAIAAFGLLLGRIHLHSRARRSELEPQFADRSFFESLRIEPYYDYGSRQELRAAYFYRRLIDDARNSLETLVHGDFSPKNVLVHDRVRLILLDHEVIHWGDPAFDLGFASAHLLSKAHHLPEHRDLLSRGVVLFWKSYRIMHEHTLPPVPVEVDWTALEGRTVRHTLGCLLARVVGRSPLEYLSTAERIRQREVCVRLIQDLPRDVPELIERFITEIESQE